MKIKKVFKVYIETYGCQMNEYDTELIKTILKEDDYEFVNTPEEAELVLLNTCSVRENANRKVYNRIHRIRHLHKNKNVKFGILGCMATNFKEKLIKDKHLKIDLVAGPDSYKRLPGLLENIDEKNHKGYDTTLSKIETYEEIYPTRLAGVNAYIAVMRGCDNFCTFCVVPYARGRERSRSVESVVNETKKLVVDGFPQVTLLGQNVNSYTHDGNFFANLLEEVSRVENIKRIRFTSPHPKDFPMDLLKIIAEKPNVCKQIHLPLQAGSTRILDLMNRTYTQKDFLDLVDEIKKQVPDVVLSTDIIIGFPTETDEEFEDTFKLMKKVQFDSAFIFKYSERENTVAARKFPDDISGEVKKERIIRLNALQKAISLKKNEAHIGQIHEVLIEQKGTKRNENEWQGRNDGNKIVLLA
ncbi:MAG: tRNA (N6-isopentenyl adenosine(37)-C2)-methylthiotransferase MiaB, partial [Calditrichia bacterium]|nr:tRNA (N6-isopentenyl adenosine(37)-C2)-methylthiotransferase MiaB [Calditrichia bacterium]